MANRKNNIKHKVSFKSILIHSIKNIILGIKFYVGRFFFRFTMFYNLKEQEIPLYRIYSRVRFDLGDPTYKFNELYESLLKTNGLDVKNPSSILVVPLIWTGLEGEWCPNAINQGFRYEALDGNHRIATLQFINRSKKLGIYAPEIMIKVVVTTSSYYWKLDHYKLLGNWGCGKKDLAYAIH